MVHSRGKNCATSGSGSVRIASPQVTLQINIPASYNTPVNPLSTPRFKRGVLVEWPGGVPPHQLKVSTGVAQDWQRAGRARSHLMWQLPDGRRPRQDGTFAPTADAAAAVCAPAELQHRLI